jgi:hypothetical protein
MNDTMQLNYFPLALTMWLRPHPSGGAGSKTPQGRMRRTRERG